MKSYMERKYYLRGLGLGIAVTAIIMGIATSGKQTMTDEEVMARAKELGMVENTVLADAQPEEIEPEAGVDIANAGDTVAEAAAEEKETTPEETKEEESSAEKKQTAPEEAKEENSTEKKQATAEETKKTETSTDSKTAADKKEDITTAAVKTITVNSGDGSYTVARKLAEAGVVTSAENFDTYLCQNGYDKKLRTGTFSIPADASDEQIARIVTGAE